jgi:PPK2 family polyphosphate:nucleotide phosphotransferase
MPRTRIELRKDHIDLSNYKTSKRYKDKADYEKHLAELQLKIQHVQQIYFNQNRRAVLVFEGCDAGGKGGSIRRLTQRLDPRGFRVYPIGAPNAEEQGRHYLFRFWRRLPPAGTWSIFDRSWYGRVLVERVEGYSSKEVWKRAYDEINEFEHTLLDDGIRVIKIFLHITKGEQLNRFEQRLHDPRKQWKLTEDDIRNRDRWDEYMEAFEDMFERTSTKAVPWNVISGNRKWYARTRVLETLIKALSKDVDLSIPMIDPRVVVAAEKRLGLKMLAAAGEADPAPKEKPKGKKDKKDKKGNSK